MNDTSFNTYSLFRLFSKLSLEIPKKNFRFMRGDVPRMNPSFAVKGCYPSELDFVPWVQLVQIIC